MAQQKKNEEGYVYVVWGRINSRHGVWDRFDGEIFQECPVLEVYTDYAKAKKGYLECVDLAVKDLLEFVGPDDEEAFKKVLADHMFLDYAPTQDDPAGFWPLQHYVSEKQDLDEETVIISWKWFAIASPDELEEIYGCEPILPRVYLERIKIR